MRNCKLTNSRISRFIHKIMANDIEIEYVKGTTNIFADMLSRIPRHNYNNTIDVRERNEITIMKMRADGNLDLSKIFNKIKDIQDKDPELIKLKSQAPKIEEAGEKHIAIYNDMLYKLDGNDSETWKIYVPPLIDEDINNSSP